MSRHPSSLRQPETDVPAVLEGEGGREGGREECILHYNHNYV